MNQAQSHLKVRSPTDVLDVMPTLLGFFPTEPLVIIDLDMIDGDNPHHFDRTDGPADQHS